MSFSLNPRPEVIKLFSRSTQLSTKFQLLIKTMILTNKEVSCYPSLRGCIYHGNKSVTLFTDKNRQEPSRTDKSRQVPTRGIFMYFRLKYYLLDHIYVLYIQISHIFAFAAPKNNEFTTLQIALLTNKKFCEAVLAVYDGCHKDFSVIPKTA